MDGEGHCGPRGPLWTARALWTAMALAAARRAQRRPGRATITVFRHIRQSGARCAGKDRSAAPEHGPVPEARVGSGFLPLSGVAGGAHDGGMRFIFAAIGLVVAALLALWLIGTVVGFVLHMLFYVVVGVLLVAGAVFLVGKAKRSLSGESRRRLPY